MSKRVIPSPARIPSTFLPSPSLPPSLSPSTLSPLGCSVVGGSGSSGRSAKYQINPIASGAAEANRPTDGRSAAASLCLCCRCGTHCEDRVDPFLHFYGSPISHLCTPRRARERRRIQFQALPSIVPYCPLYSSKNAFIIMADPLRVEFGWRLRAHRPTLVVSKKLQGF